MAFVQITAQRFCPSGVFEVLEPIIADHVGEVIYGSRWPEEAEVTAASQHGTLGRLLELDVRVDTEDLPQPGWLRTTKGLCVPPDAKIERSRLTGEITEEGLTEHELFIHHRLQAKTISLWLASKPIWNDRIGWNPQRDPRQKIGTLVSKVAGGWYATDTVEETVN